MKSFFRKIKSNKCYGKYNLGEQALAVILPFIYLPYYGFAEKEVYIEPANRVRVRKSVVREWTDAIIFAVVARETRMSVEGELQPLGLLDGPFSHSCLHVCVCRHQYKHTDIDTSKWI